MNCKEMFQIKTKTILRLIAIHLIKVQCVQEVLWELLHVPRPAALQDGLPGDGGGGAARHDRLLRLRGLGRVQSLLRRGPQPGQTLSKLSIASSSCNL